MTTNLPPVAPSSVRDFATLRRGGSRFDITDIITYLFLIVGVIIMFGPVVWLVMSSFKDASLIRAGDPTFLPYRQIEEEVDGYDEALPIYDVVFKDTYFNNAKVSLPDIRADNGTIHGVDSVLIPDALSEQLRALGGGTSDIQPSDADIVEVEGTLLDVLQGQERFEVMKELIAASSLGDVLSGEERYTLLTPTDAAWAEFEREFGSVSALQENPDLLNDLLSYHILNDRYLLVNTYRLEEPVVTTLFEDAQLDVSLREGETERLAQVGSPTGANFTFVDPDNPEAGEITVGRFNTASGDTNVEFDAVREVHFSFDNYSEGIEAFDFWIYFRNSTVVTIIATIITLLINSMAAFGLSKYKFFGRDAIFIIIISTLMVPVSVILVPAFLVISKVNWVNDLWGLIIPGAATPTGVFLLRQYMLTIPDELLDAARIDGASEWRIFWQVIMPLAKPALAVLAIFSIMWRWNDFLWPLVVLSNNELFTLPVGLKAFQGALNSQEHLILAMTVLTLLPITIIFAFLQRYITSGIATTGMK